MNLQEYRFNGFMHYYDNIKLINDKLLYFEDKEIIDYITECIRCFRKNYDLKMKFVSIVSIIELLITHSPDGNRYNVEDSINRQFKNKLSLIAYLDNKESDTEKIFKECDYIYSIRSDISHGNFRKLDTDLKYYFNFCKENGYIAIKTYERLYTMDKLICRTVNYMIIALKQYLDNKKLFEIVKKI